MKPVMIVGAGGQDGRLLSQLVEQAGCPVVKINRGDVDLLSRAAIESLLQECTPSEIYYLPAHHHSAQDPLGTDDAAHFQRSFDIHVSGLVNFLEAIRLHSPTARLFYAASSHIFGYGGTMLQNEQTPHDPQCIYGITKTAGMHCCRYYRQSHGVFVSVGILYNHESHFRGPQFVSQKIIQSALAIAAGNQEKLTLGDLSSRVDWGFAPDYVKAMRHVLSLPKADDFVIATGENHSVQEFVEIVFEAVGLDWRKHVAENPSLITKQPRRLTGDSSKLRATGWGPTVSFRQMVLLMLNAQRHDG